MALTPIDEIKTQASADVKAVETKVDTAVKAERVSIVAKVQAFAATYKLHAAIGAASYAGGHFKLLSAAFALVKHVL